MNEVSCTITGFFVYSTGKTNQYINFLVTDVNLEKGYVTVSPNTLNISSEGGPLSFDINTNDAWTIAPVEGLTISPLSGTGKGSVAVTVPANSAFESKTFSIVVSTAEKNATVTVKQSAASDPSATVYELTNEEITSALATATQNAYSAYTINSASGVWSAKLFAQKGLKYIQLRNKEASHLKTPEFAKEIAKIEIVTDETRQTTDRKVYLFAADYKPIETSGVNYNSTTDNVGTNFKNASIANGKIVAKSSTPVVIEVPAGHKQLVICTYDGAVYISSIKVYLR